MYAYLTSHPTKNEREIKKLKNELEGIYKKRTARKLDKIKRNQIQNNMYDVHVLQQQRNLRMKAR